MRGSNRHTVSMSEKTIPQRKTNARRIALDKLDWGDPQDAGKRLPRRLAQRQRLQPLRRQRRHRPTPIRSLDRPRDLLALPIQC